MPDVALEDPIAMGENQDTVFLGRDITRSQHISEDTARRVDAAVSEIINGQYRRAQQIITEHRVALDKIAQALIEHETIEGKHVMEIVKQGEILSPIIRESLSPKAAGKATDKKIHGKAAPEDLGGPAPAPNPA